MSRPLATSVRSPTRGLRGAVPALAALLIVSIWDRLVEKARYALEVLAACSPCIPPNLVFPRYRVDWSPNVITFRARRKNNSERPTDPQPEPFCEIRARLGNANLNSGNIRGSCNTTIYNMDTVACGERARRDNLEGPASFLPTISTSVGNDNKGCGNIENSGGTHIYL